MAKFKPWLKMWVEWIDDLKMLDLTLAEQGAWWRLCALAQKCAAGGALVKDNGTPLSMDEIASTLRIKAGADRKTFDAMIQKLSTQGSLHLNSNALVITHFAERQARVASETPEEVRVRVRRHRERKIDVTEKPLQNETAIISPPPQEAEAEAEAEKTPLQRSLHPLHVTENSLHLSLALAKVTKLHEQFFGIITPVLSEKFKDFVKNFSGPVEWIDLAFAEAVKYKKRRWQYVESILYSWQEKGAPHADRREPGDDTHQQDNFKSDRFGGFKAIESGPDDRDED